MKSLPFNQHISLMRLTTRSSFIFALALIACSDQSKDIAVCPLRDGLATELVPTGFEMVEWEPIGIVYYPRGWQAKVGPHNEGILIVRSLDATGEISFEASCCRGSDLFRKGKVVLWSGRSVWSDQRSADGVVVQRFFTFPFASVDPEQLRSSDERVFRPPLGLSATARCRSPEACADVRQIVRSIRYDRDASRLAEKGDERIARIGAASVEDEATLPQVKASVGSPPPPPIPSPLQPTFTSKLCED